MITSSSSNRLTKMYIDNGTATNNSEAGLATIGDVIDDYTFLIGSNYSGTLSFKGLIYEVAIYASNFGSTISRFYNPCRLAYKWDYDITAGNELCINICPDG
jgi:hypothetical protein